jgi:NAD(P)-dependent dehydrogenase (short-subunit alcohol dehydrogenase family)
VAVLVVRRPMAKARELWHPRRKTIMGDTQEMPTDLQLNDRVVVVTGASRGLGRAMAMALAQAGARLVLASPESKLLQDAAAEIEAKCGAGRALAVPADITRKADCERVLASALERFGALHVLVNNARRPHRGPGLPPEGNTLPFWESDPDIWQETVQVNVNGTFLISHVITPHLIAQGWGRIVNLTTSLDTMQRGHNSPYGVTKAALEAATMIWAQDLAGTGVTVNSLIPGGSCDSDPDRPPPKAGRKLLPVDIMNPLVVWLASDLSDGQTGGRYVGKLWDPSLPPNEAAERAREAPVLRAPEVKRPPA